MAPLGRIVALAAAMTMCLAASAHASTPNPLMVANAAWPGSPCSGQLRVVFDATLSARGHAEEATGIIPWADRPWELRSCEISVDPAVWARADTESRCLWLVHGAGHLDGHDHAAHGVMAAMPERGSVPACLTLRGRIAESVKKAAATPWVKCGAWRGRVLPCVATLNDGRRVAYRASTRGAAITITANCGRSSDRRSMMRNPCWPAR